MAIIVDEQRRGASGADMGSIMIWLGLIGIIAAAAYYLFFAQPELIEVAAPSGFQATEQISKIDLSADDVVGSSGFKALTEHVTLPENGTFGRPNPFQGFPEMETEQPRLATPPAKTR